MWHLNLGPLQHLEAGKEGETGKKSKEQPFGKEEKQERNEILVGKIRNFREKKVISCVKYC